MHSWVHIAVILHSWVQKIGYVYSWVHIAVILHSWVQKKGYVYSWKKIENSLKLVSTHSQIFALMSAKKQLCVLTKSTHSFTLWTATKSSILNFWSSPFACDLQLYIVFRGFIKTPEYNQTKVSGGVGGGIHPMAPICVQRNSFGSSITNLDSSRMIPITNLEL